MKKFQARILISVLTIYITLGIIEMIVRWVPLYPQDLSVYDPEVGEVFAPNAGGVRLNPGCWRDYRQYIQINSLGLRDSEHTYERNEKFRILLLGDSFGVGYEVGLDETFHQIIEQELDIEIIAGAHGGWGTDNQLLWYTKEGHKYKADLVLLLFQPGNDIQDNSFGLNHVPNQTPYFSLESEGLVLHHEIHGQKTQFSDLPVSGPVHEFMLRHSKLYNLFVLRLRRMQLVTGELSHGDGLQANTGESSIYKQMYADAFDLTMHLVDALAEEVRANDSEFMVVIASSDKNIFEGGNNTEFTQAFENAGYDTVDLLPGLSAVHESGVDVHFSCDGHWTKSGHRAVAKILVPELILRINPKE